MRVREAEPGEGALIAEEFWHPLAREMEAYSELNGLTDDAVESAREGFEDLLERDEWFIYLLEEDGTEVAYISCEIGERPTRALGRYTSIVDLYVEEGYRGRGFGTALVERAEALAEQEDCDFVRVSAEWGNEAAREFYEKRGYERKQVKYSNRLE